MSTDSDVPEALVLDYDPFTTATTIDENVAEFAERRERCPMSFSNKHDGFWLATRYDDIVEVSKRREVFSTYPSSIEGAGKVGQTSKLIPLELDGEEHLAYRH